jgi:hypothetical protein
MMGKLGLTRYERELKVYECILYSQGIRYRTAKRQPVQKLTSVSVVNGFPLLNFMARGASVHIT